MEKEKKTYRFSREVIDIIESRDRTRYSTANDFVEKAILESAGKKTKVGIEEKLEKLQANDQKIIHMLQQLLDRDDYFPKTTL